ncbi:helix-turn-helix transcriptional regulator [Halomicrobium urmianum]|uniref:helix-turn-helix transcriptional regulator n=1 Tax=Halomicrobium urmianum TaxID=1586233 RepID=UPI001CD9CDEA|nr:hypothetical protein [Halomicrobium urmianum]
MGDDEVFGDVRFLTGSEQRVAILDTLCDGPARPTDLCDRVPVTRTTVQRVLAGFLERHWVVKRDGRYHVTGTGRRVREAYAEFVGTVERARQLGPIVADLGDACGELPDAAYETAEVTVATEQEPLAAVDRLIEWLEAGAGGHLRLVTPIVARTFNRTAMSLLERGTTFEMVIDEGVLQQSASAFPDALARAREHGGVEVFVHPDPLSFGLTLRDGSALVAGYDDANNLRGLFVSENEDVRAWAERTYGHVVDRATPLEEALSDE